MKNCLRIIEANKKERRNQSWIPINQPSKLKKRYQKTLRQMLHDTILTTFEFIHDIRK